MDFEFTEQEKLFYNTAKSVVAREIDPVLASHPPDRPLPKEAVLGLFRVVEPLGYFGARIPPEEGGSGLTCTMVGILNELLYPSLAINCVAQEATVKRIHLGATALQRERFLPDLVKGRRITATAISEPNVGSDTRGIQTTATRDGDYYRISGTKTWITNASILDVVAVIASLGKDQQGRPRTTRFIVDRQESPFEAREIPTLGLQQGHLGQLVFADCKVPAENMLGEPGDASRALTFTWLAQRPWMGLLGVQLAQKALDRSVEYARNRVQFGRPIGGFQLIQQILAEMATLIDAGRLLCYRALSLVDQGLWCHKESAMAKYFATEMAVKVTSLAIQIHGALGLTRELGLERLWRDARMLTIPEGTTQIQQLIVGRELTGIRAFS